MPCKNPYCPVDFKPNKEPCKSCKSNIEEIDTMDLPPGFEELFRGFKK